MVGIGYAAAFLAASLATTAYVALTQTPDRRTAQGMYAFGDTVVFLGVLGVAALPATGVALYFLRGARWLWSALSALALALGITAVVAAAACLVPHAMAPAWLRAVAMPAPLCILAAPVLAATMCVAGIVAPGPFRAPMLAAAALEAVAFVAVALRWWGALY